MTKPRVTILYGSPRKNGNSATLGKELGRALREYGIVPDEFYLHGLNASPCSACDGCQRSEEFACIVKDGMIDVLLSAASSDYLILAAPIYNFTFSAQLKIFLDRSYSLWKPEGSVMNGKKIVLILTYADENAESSGVFNAIKTIEDGYRFVKAEIVDILHYTADKAGEIAENSAAMSRAFRTGEGIAVPAP